MRFQRQAFKHPLGDETDEFAGVQKFLLLFWFHPQGALRSSGPHTFVGAAELTPGRGRSKVRRTVLAQDGHSLGEEAIYQLLWRSARPENSDPNGARVNMAKKNVRQNIARLFEKLAIEVLESFAPMNSQAHLYRIFSYKQILERRRAHGLEFILRNKGFVFCTLTGEVMHLSPAYQTSPGDETSSLRPAAPKAIRRAVESEKPVPKISPSSGEELIPISQALNQ